MTDGGATPFPDSLCHGCAHLRRVVSGKGAVFLRCAAPELGAKYPRQPVHACPAFQECADPPSPASLKV